MLQLARRYDLPHAARALRALLRDPDDLPQVFSLIDALPGRAPEELRGKLLATGQGRALLERQPDIVPLLTDRARLRAMPGGSLAHAYLAFVEREQISPEGILQAARSGGGRRLDERFRWQRARMRDTHDLWHAATGYQGDVLGELALLAFLLGQQWHPGVALVVTGAVLKGFKNGVERNHAWVVAEGYVRGKRAAWLPAALWEELLPLPLGEVRERLNLGTPPRYQPLRSSELRARGVVQTRA